MDPPDEELYQDDYLEILSVASDEDDEQSRDETTQLDQPATNEDNFETPPPVLTIGSVLDQLPKLKTG
jgi:hypothetical protein